MCIVICISILYANLNTHILDNNIFLLFNTVIPSHTNSKGALTFHFTPCHHISLLKFEVLYNILYYYFLIEYKSSFKPG